MIRELNLIKYSILSQKKPTLFMEEICTFDPAHFIEKSHHRILHHFVGAGNSSHQPVFTAIVCTQKIIKICE
jgi:hypothetical protein